jgi:hypothetical protein
LDRPCCLTLSSRIRVGAIQLFNRPALIIEVVKKFSLKALYLPDRKRIMLDSTIPKLKHRWNEAHEVGHSLLPWHEEMMHGDNAHTLSKDCMEHVEAEANFAGGRLLFLQDRFVEEARSSAIEIDSVRRLQSVYGNTLSTTLWRFVEGVGDAKPVVAMMTCHPHVSRRPMDFNPAKPCRHFIQSSAFMTRFSKLSELALFDAVASYCGAQRGGLLGQREVILLDDRDSPNRFYFETFFNRYDALTLGVHLAEQPVSVAVGARADTFG